MPYLTHSEANKLGIIYAIMGGRHYTALGYCDEMDIENFLLTDIDNNFSQQIEDWIAGSESEINKFLGYTSPKGILVEDIVNEVAHGRVDSEGNLCVYVRKQPVTTVSGIQLFKGSSTVDLTLTTTAGTNRWNVPPGAEYVLFPSWEFSTSSSSMLTNFYTLRGSKFFVRISYRGGYDEVPADIRLATVNLVSDKIMRHSNKEGLESISQGRVTKRWRDREDGESDFVKDAYKLLRPYRMASRWI